MNFGPLQFLIEDPALTDLLVNGQGEVWADWGQGMRRASAAIPFSNPEVVRQYAVGLCSQLGKRLDDACPIADASTHEGIRVHAVIAPLVPQGAAISIRIPSSQVLSLEDLGSKGLFPHTWLPVLKGLVDNRASILITGGTGAGKTTLLKALLAQCPDGERIVSVEEVRELGGLAAGNHVSLVSRESNVEGAGMVSLSDLVKATLRMRPDRVVLGECRGEEIADLLRAFNSGHKGGMVTLHADGVSRVPARLVSLGMLAGISAQAMALLAQGAFDAVLHLECSAGGRVLTQIGCLASESGRLVGRPIALWDGQGRAVPGPLWEWFQRRWSSVCRPGYGEEVAYGSARAIAA
ncbi:pilus assembly protein [Bifidobacterium aemilianum]|uniref:Pilus assembly protein n=1 Tax=Bifidobacterium aemilianum TaxID=2493120 RepID=A0A366K671_9BIFI|nr:ATPase, T2SS/T4P/T4SS family [Bifidobacterium aemilianum]RBP97240.1 pilus assembly protein [Bifidobacterium aemilianum]